MKIGILGCSGRVGQNLVKELYYKNPHFLGGGLVSPNSTFIGKDIGEVIGVKDTGLKITADVEEICKTCNVLIDFTNNRAAIANIEAAARYHIPVVVGTTGFNDHQENLIKELAKQTVIVKAPNTSLGMNLLFKLVQCATEILGHEDYDIEIIEKHHKNKKDAPSGTALYLGNIIATALGKDLKNIYHSNRKGISEGREEGKIGFHAVRGGDLTGAHTIMFIGNGEVIELTHSSTSRAIYAVGSIKAAKWAVNQKNGLYSFNEVLDIKANACEVVPK